jgi:hypothetical protein
MSVDDLPGHLAVVAGALYVIERRRPVRVSAAARGERIALARATSFIAGLAALVDVYRLLERTGTARGRLAPQRAEAGGM